MINLNNLNRQHNSIKYEVDYLESEVRKGALSMDASELARHINILAGQLRIHLMEEDKFLYPDLLDCNDPEIQKLANEYLEEMGNLASVYTSFKNNYNVGRKINENKEAFLKELQVIMKVLKERITKEDNELYRLVQLKNL